MGATTEIAWTESTFNPWIGCSRVSPGCLHCYAEARDRRVGDHLWGANAPRRRTTAAYWRQPLKWNRNALERGRPGLVFCASLADVFEDRADLDDIRADLFDLIEQTPGLRWQLLTKRPENVLRMVPARWLLTPAETEETNRVHLLADWRRLGRPGHNWPAHAWIGSTVEDQQRAGERIPELLEVPARVRFLSCEPLLGPLDLSPWLGLEWMETLRPPGAPLSFRGDGGWGMDLFEAVRRSEGNVPRISWAIVGGESGPKHRKINAQHARDVCAQVLAAEVPLFFKQWGGSRPSEFGHLIDPHDLGAPRAYHELPAEATS